MSGEASRAELFPRVWVLVGLVGMSTKTNVSQTVSLSDILCYACQEKSRKEAAHSEPLYNSHSSLSKIHCWKYPSTP